MSLYIVEMTEMILGKIMVIDFFWTHTDKITLNW